MRLSKKITKRLLKDQTCDDCFWNPIYNRRYVIPGGFCRWKHVRPTEEGCSSWKKREQRDYLKK